MSHPAERTRAPRSRPLLLTGLVLLVLFVAMGAAVLADPQSPWTQAADNAWRALIGVGPSSPLPTSPVAMFFQQLGQLPGLVVMGIALPIVLAIVGRWRSALFVFVVQLAGPGLVSQLAKNIVDRPRPAADEAAGLYGPLFTVDHGSFPSGHAVSAAVAAVTILALIPAHRRVLLVLGYVLAVVLLVGIVWQRTLINAHWLSDTFAGILAGLGTALVLQWAFQPWLRRDHGRRPWFLRAPAVIAAA